MRATKRQRLVLAGLAALALAYGASRSLRLPERGEESLNEPSIGEQAGAPTEIRMTGPAAVPPRRSVAVASRHRVTEPASSPEWPVMLETASEQPPMDLGELLDADSGETRESIALGVDPINIGPALDANDPLAYEPGTPYVPPSNIGDPLDADDPGTSPMAREDPVSIGPSLDADDPQSWDFHQPAPPAVEIGEILEAGTPNNR